MAEITLLTNEMKETQALAEERRLAALATKAAKRAADAAATAAAVTSAATAAAAAAEVAAANDMAVDPEFVSEGDSDDDLPATRLRRPRRNEKSRPLTSKSGTGLSRSCQRRGCTRSPSGQPFGDRV